MRRRKRPRIKTLAKTALGVGIAGGVVGAVASRPSVVDNAVKSTGAVANLGASMLETSTNIAKLGANVISSEWLFPLGGMALLAYGYLKR